MFLSKLVTLAAVISLFVGARTPSAPQEDTIRIQIEFTATHRVEDERVPLTDLAIELHGYGKSNASHQGLDTPVTCLTDEQGAQYVLLELTPELHERFFTKRPYVIVRVRDSRFTFQEITVRLREREENLFEGKVRPRTGGTVRGRVVNLAGDPATARVGLYSPNLKPSQGMSIGAIRVDVHEFELHYRDPGEYELSAFSSGTGKSLGQTLNLTGGLYSEELVVQMQGEGTISGRMLDARGEPVEGVLIYAGFEAPLTSADAKQWNGGITGDRVQTDAEGAFRFGGLCAGQFRIYYSLGCEKEKARAVTVPTDTLDLELLCDVHRIALTVIDEHGSPLRLDDFNEKDLPHLVGSYSFAEFDRKHELRDFPFSAEFAEGFLNKTTETTRCNRITRGEFEHTFAAHPGRSYQLRLLPQKGPPMARVILCKEDELLARVEFQLPKPESLGTLKIALDEKFPPAFNREYAFFVRRSVDDVLLFRGRFNGRESELRLEPGEYDVVVLEHNLLWHRKMSVSERRRATTVLFTHEQAIAIESGENSLVSVPPPTGGRVKLAIELVHDAKAATSHPIPAVTIVRASSTEPLPIRWMAALDELHPAEFELGEGRVALEIFEPGDYEVLVTCEGFAPARASFEVRAGQYANPRLRLTR